MKTKNKKIITLALVLAMSCSALPCDTIMSGIVGSISVSAITSADTNWEYTLDGTDATITAYKGSDIIITIPATIDGNNVTALNNNVFKENTSITKVTFAGDIATVSSNSFAYCTALQSVTFNGNVGTINSAFTSCTALQSVTFNGNVETVNGFAFGNCSNLKTLTFKGNLGTFSASSGLTSLTSVTIDGNLTLLNGSAFGSCTALTSFSVGGDVGTFYGDSLGSCTALQSVTVGGNVGTVSAGALHGCTALTSFSVGGNVGTVSAGALYDCSNLKTLTFKGNLGTYSASSGLTSLTSFTVGGDLTLLDGGALKGCTALTSFSVGGNVGTFSNGVLINCSNLKTISINGSIGTWYEGAFNSIPSLETLKIGGDVPAIGQATFWGSTGLKILDIGGSIDGIDDEAFQNCMANNSLIFVKDSTAADLFTSLNYTPSKTTIAYKVKINGLVSDLAYADAKNGSAITILGFPTRQGYIFAGYYDNPQYSGRPINSSVVYGTELYAKWMQSDGGTASTNTEIVNIPVAPASTTKNTVITGADLSSEDVVTRVIKQIKSAKSGSTITVKVDDATISKEILKELKGKNITLVIIAPNGTTSAINGTEITKTNADVNLNVKYNTKNIPAKLVNKAKKLGTTSQFSFGDDKAFGMECDLTVKFSAKNEGKTVKLYRYDAKNGKLVLVAKSTIGTNGKTTFEDLTKGGDFIAVIK